MDPTLYKAATQGDVSKLQQQVEKNPTILSATTPQRNTVLHLAALYGHTGFAAEVLKKIENLHVAKNDDGDTPLHLAARAGKQEVAELLARHAVALQPSSDQSRGALGITNNAGNSALHEAVRHRRAAVAAALLDADLSCGRHLNARRESPLHIAAREGLVNVVWKILNSTAVEVVLPNSTAVEVVRPVPSPSGTALHQAVIGGHIRIMEILLQKRPELIDLTDSYGNSALHYAAQKNDPRAAELLLNTRMELVYQSNHSNQPALHVAAHYGSTDAIRTLLRHCPDVAEMLDNDGRNALHVAVAQGRLNALRCLLRHIRPPELLNRADRVAGDTPLHLAAKMSRVASVLILLGDRRVDPCIPNRDGQTARSLVEAKIHRGEGDTPLTHETYLWKQLKQQESKRCRTRMHHVPPPRAANPSRRRVPNDQYSIVATLIVTVTFAAAFTMPGGYDQNKGIVLQGHSTAFKIFVVSNTVALCSSIVVVVCYIWSWNDPINLEVEQRMWAHRLTVVACISMLISFTNAVYITVAPISRWPAYAVISICASTPILVIFLLGKEVIFVPL